MTSYYGFEFSEDEKDLKHLSDDVLVFAENFSHLSIEQIYDELNDDDYIVIYDRCNNRIRGIRCGFVEYVATCCKEENENMSVDIDDENVLEAFKIAVYNQVLNKYKELTYDESEYLFGCCASVF